MHRSFRKAPRDPFDWRGPEAPVAQDAMEARRHPARRALPIARPAPPAQIDLTVRGDGPTLLFVSGSFSTGAAWRSLLAELPFAARTATLSLCGYGQTAETRSLGNDGIAHEVAVVRSALERLATPVTLVGHSFGGTVALAAALQAPEQVSGLVLFEANPMDVLRLAGEKRLLEEGRALAAAFEVAVSKNVPDAPALVIDYWDGPGSFARLPGPVRDYCREKASTNVLDWRSDFGFPADRLASIRCPVMLGRGARANAAMVAMTEATARMLPAARTIVVDGAGHFPIATHPADCARLVADFVG